MSELIPREDILRDNSQIKPVEGQVDTKEKLSVEDYLKRSKGITLTEALRQAKIEEYQEDQRKKQELEIELRTLKQAEEDRIKRKQRAIGFWVFTVIGWVIMTLYSWLFAFAFAGDGNTHQVVFGCVAGLFSFWMGMALYKNVPKIGYNYRGLALIALPLFVITYTGYSYFTKPKAKIQTPFLNKNEPKYVDATSDFIMTPAEKAAYELQKQTEREIAEGKAAFKIEDYKAAFPLLFKNQDSNLLDAEAQFNLGYMYDAGKGILQNNTKALKWYRKSVAQGYAPAQYDLAVMYKNGQGVTIDLNEAIRFYRLAAKQKFQPAILALKRLGYAE